MEALNTPYIAGYTEDMLQQVSPDGAPLLLLHPALLLTEAQTDYLSWPELKSCIDLRIYIDAKVYPFSVESVRLNPNQMMISMIRPGCREGIYLPPSDDRVSLHLRYEWALDFGQYGLCDELKSIEISHNQQVILGSHQVQKAVPPLVLAIGGEKHTSTELAISTDIYHLNRRADVTQATVDSLDGSIIVSETVSAAFIDQLWRSA